MEYRVETEYTRSLITSAAWKFWMKRRWTDAILSLVVLGIVGYLFFVRGSREWWIGFFLAIGLIYALAVYGGFLTYRRASMRSLVAMGRPVATWVFAEDAISSESALGKADIKWSTIKELLRFDDVWLLVYAAGNYSTLPIHSLSPEAKSFIETKVLSAGGKVT
jgi:hypothetical protein